MIEGFTKTVIRCNGVDLAVHRAGQGRPLLLIHGFPQNHMCWESVAPQLARRHDVIIPDLRGYGESSAPTNDPSNTTYSKRTMAQDMADLLTALDISRADVLGHDRGARRKNNVTALIGPSGCGKSTFLRALNRMNDFVDICRTKGSVDIDGTDIYRTQYTNVNNLRKRVQIPGICL